MSNHFKTGYIITFLVPDWVCEILSPSTTRDDRVVKMPLYARESVGHIWLIDPDQKTLEVYALQDGRWLLLGAHKDDERISLPPFGCWSWSCRRFGLEAGLASPRSSNATAPISEPNNITNISTWHLSKYMQK